MKNNQDLDLMLESFLSDNQVEDCGFSENVLQALPQTPRFLWLSEIVPAFATFAVCFSVWKMDLLSWRKILNIISEVIDFKAIQSSTLSFNVSAGVVLACVLIALYVTYEKFVDEV